MKGENKLNQQLETTKKIISYLEDKEKYLMQALGKKKFERVVNSISEIIKEECLDATPTILEDTLDYLLKINLI